MKSSTPALCATLPLLALCACGDSRRDLVGSYDTTGTVTFTYSESDKEIQKVDAPLTIVADAFDSDMLYVDFDCGLPGKMDEPGFVINQKVCPAYDTDSCTLIWTYNNGGGSKEDGATLALNPGGIIKIRCSDGSSGQFPFFFTLSGTPSVTTSGDPGAQDTRSTLRTAFHRAFERARHASTR